MSDPEQTTFAGADNPLRSLIGGPQGAIESVLPPLVFVVTYAATGDNLLLAASAATVFGLILAGLRVARGERPVRVRRCSDGRLSVRHWWR